MKSFSSILFGLLIQFNLLAQFSTESQIVTYMSAKEFYSDSYQMTVSYEFIPKYNTYGIICVNKSNEKFYYINCNVRPYGSSADINGMSIDGAGNFGFRLYEGRISVQGENFYMKGSNQTKNISTNNTTSNNDDIMNNYGSMFGASQLKTALKPSSTEEIKKFQDWMDKNHPGWVNGKNLSKGTGYGNWGPSTEKAWEKYKSVYK